MQQIFEVLLNGEILLSFLSSKSYQDFFFIEKDLNNSNFHFHIKKMHIVFIDLMEHFYLVISYATPKLLRIL